MSIIQIIEFIPIILVAFSPFFLGIFIGWFDPERKMKGKILGAIMLLFIVIGAVIAPAIETLEIFIREGSLPTLSYVSKHQIHTIVIGVYMALLTYLGYRFRPITWFKRKTPS